MSPTARIRALLVPLAACLAAGACGGSPPPPDAGAKRYGLTGQVVAVRPEIGEIRIAHEAVPGYMDAMTMSFAVKDRATLAGRQRGDLVRATLVVTPTDAWLENVQKTGFAAVAEPPEEAPGPAPAFVLLEPGQPVPDVPLVDQDARAWSAARLQGRATALTFIYTRCPLPTYCPLMDRHFRSVQRLVASKPGLADRVQLVTVSFDPEFDTPAVLKQHAASLGADLRSWSFLTGRREDVEGLAARFGVSVMRDPAKPIEITHNLRTAVIGPDGRVVTIHGGNEWTPEQLAKDLEAAAAR